MLVVQPENEGGNKIIQVTPNVYVESSIPICNLGIVTTSEGIVMIDVPMNPASALKWRDEVNKKGQVRYVINTEEHGDHCNNSWFYPGVLITSKVTRETLAKVPATEVRERIKSADPAIKPLMKSYQLRLADITFTENLTLYLGDHTFQLFPVPGHSPGGIAVYIPQEKVVFTADCVLHHVITAIKAESDPERWLESLRRLGELDVDIIVPGHGSIGKKDYLKEQAGIIRRWVELVQSAIKQGLSEDEAVANIPSPDPYPIQPGWQGTEAERNKRAIASLYQFYSKK